MKPLAIIPTFVTQMQDTEMCRTTVRTLRETVGDSCDVLLVDDGSPGGDLVNRLRGIAAEWNCELVAKERNEGFAKTVNIGLNRALGEGRDAILVNADIEFTNKTWLDDMSRMCDKDGLAPVVGALLLYPHGLIQHAGIFFCSPGDEPVLTAHDGYVAISELDPEEHGLVSYARKENRIFRCASDAGRRMPGSGRRSNGYGFTVEKARFRGEMVTVSTRGGQARVTPNHRLTIHWSGRALGGWGVYVMRQGSKWRVGHTKMAQSGGPGTRGWGFGPRLRLGQQCGDALWLLSVHADKQDALAAENLLAWTHGVPTLQFVTSNTGIDQSRLDGVWRELDVEPGALELLRNFDRDPLQPLLQRAPGRRAPVGPSRRYEIAAANLMGEGLMRVPTDPGKGQKPEALELEVRRDYFDGPVFSLDVPPYAHYVSGGVVVHNSLLTREFEHFYRYGPGNLREAHIVKACPVTGALQFIRHDALRELGVYDERFFLGFEDVDYCLRVFDSGRQCMFNPDVTAIHHESFFRGRPSRKIADWQARSWIYLAEKWGKSSFNGTTFAQFLPELV